MKKLQAEMTPVEVAEMQHLMKHVTFPIDFEYGYRMGFLAGKVSTLTDVINNYSTYFKHGTTTRCEGEPPAGSEERVEAEGPKGNTGAVHGERENEASD